MSRTRWDLINPRQQLVHSFYQDDEPQEDVLNAFRNVGAPGWTLRPSPLNDDEVAALNEGQRRMNLPDAGVIADALFRRELGDAGPLQRLVTEFQSLLIRYPDRPPPPPPKG